MKTDAPNTGRRYRVFARVLLLAGLGLFLFSTFFYTSVFFAAGKGIAVHSGRLSLIVGTGPGGNPAGFTCMRTEPVVLFKPIFVTKGTLFVAAPLWVVGLPAGVLLGIDAWMIIRARRGRCFACGYSLAGLRAGSPCPECGLAPDLRYESPRHRARAVVANLLNRALTTLACVGVVVSLAWVGSGFFAPAISVSRRNTVGLSRGCIEVRWTYPVLVPVTSAPMPAPVLSFTSSMGWGSPPPMTPPPPPAPPPSITGPAPLKVECPPLHPIGWRFEHDFGHWRRASADTVMIPLWWFAVPLLACAIPAVRRRLAAPRRVRAMRPVSSSGETA
jgi:hypothetical protein